MAEPEDDWRLGEAGTVAVPAYEEAARRLRRAIHLGEVGPGSPLPADRVLANQLGVSRVTLREAIRMLEGEGYVEMYPGSRFRMSVSTGAMEPSEVRAWIRGRWSELEALLEFRLINERSAAERAATRANRSQVAQLRRIVDSHREGEDDNAFRLGDVRFHLQIARLAESRLLLHAVEEARAELYVPFRGAVDTRMLAISIPQHSAIVDAIEAKDAKSAGRAMAKHLAATEAEWRRLAGRD